MTTIVLVTAGLAVAVIALTAAYRQATARSEPWNDSPELRLTAKILVALFLVGGLATNLVVDIQARNAARQQDDLEAVADTARHEGWKAGRRDPSR